MFLPLFSLTCVQTWMWTCWKCLWRRASSGPGCCHVIVTGTRAHRGRQSPAGPAHPDAGLRGMCCGCPPLGRNWDGLTRQRCWCCGQMGRHQVPAEVGRYRVGVTRKEMEGGLVKKRWYCRREGVDKQGGGCGEEEWGAKGLEKDKRLEGVIREEEV